jgi:hypothetical protein
LYAINKTLDKKNRIYIVIYCILLKLDFQMIASTNFEFDFHFHTSKKSLVFLRYNFPEVQRTMCLSIYHSLINQNFSEISLFLSFTLYFYFVTIEYISKICFEFLEIHHHYIFIFDLMILILRQLSFLLTCWIERI